MRNNSQLYSIILFSLLFLSPQYAAAGLSWGTITKGLHHASSSISNAGRHVGNTISSSAHSGWNSVSSGAQSGWNSISSGAHNGWNGISSGAQNSWNGGLYGINIAKAWANQQAEAAKRAALLAAKKTQQIANEGWSYINKLAQNPTGNCEQVQRDIRGEVMKYLSPAIDNTIGKLPPQVSTAFLTTATCKSDMGIGFRCGIFPYAEDIVSALKQGGRAGKHFAHNVGMAARGVCRNVNITMKGNCAISAAIAMDAQKSLQCIKDIASQNGGFQVASGFNEQAICTKTGEFVFGMALNSAIANSAGAYKTAVKFSLALRSILAKTHDMPLPASCRL